MKLTLPRSTATMMMVCFAVSMAWAQSASRDTTAARPSKADAAFLKQAAENGHAEVESSTLALKKLLSDTPVRRFAQTMVEDHQRAGNELKELATSKGVEVPDRPSMVQQAKLKVLSVKDGDAFAKSYMEQMGITAHKDTIALFEKAASRAEDADIKAFASRTLPALRKHMTMAQELHPAGSSAHSGTSAGSR